MNSWYAFDGLYSCKSVDFRLYRQTAWRKKMRANALPGYGKTSQAVKSDIGGWVRFYCTHRRGVKLVSDFAWDFMRVCHLLG